MFCKEHEQTLSCRCVRHSEPRRRLFQGLDSTSCNISLLWLIEPGEWYLYSAFTDETKFKKNHINYEILSQDSFPKSFYSSYNSLFYLTHIFIYNMYIIHFNLIFRFICTMMHSGVPSCNAEAGKDVIST